MSPSSRTNQIPLLVKLLNYLYLVGACGILILISGGGVEVVRDDERDLTRFLSYLSLFQFGWRLASFEHSSTELGGFRLLANKS